MNDRSIRLPYKTNKVEIYKVGTYTAMDTHYFSLMFDGQKFIKFQQCASEICGVCGNHNNDPLDDLSYEKYIANKKCANKKRKNGRKFY